MEIPPSHRDPGSAPEDSAASGPAPARTEARRYLSGVSALAELPLLQSRRDALAGLNTAGFISGYRGSPVAGLDQMLLRAGKALEERNIRFLPGINEELAATAVWGSQQAGMLDRSPYDGVFGMWYAKAPGVDRSTDALRHANAAGTSPNGGVLALIGDDHASKSSSLAAQSEMLCRHIMMPVLYPATVQEVLDYGLFGWALSRFSGLWAAMKCLIDTLDAAAPVVVDAGRVSVQRPAGWRMPPGGVNIRWPDSPLEQEARLLDYKLPAALAFTAANRIDRTDFRSPDARIGILTAGKSYLDVRQALQSLGLDGARAEAAGLALYKPGMVWPLEGDGVRRFAAGLEQLVVVEEKAGLLEEQVRSALYALPESMRPRVVGKTDEEGRPLFSAKSEMDAARIALLLGERLLKAGRDEALEGAVARLRAAEAQERKTNLARRVPHYCAGCPHNTSTTVPEGSRAMAGIGCHYMAQWMDRSTDTFTQMGGEGANWLGLAPFSETRHVFVNLGDGTYVHSGSLAIRAAVAAGANVTYKILYNDAVAMTGGQQVEGAPPVSQIVAQLQAEGVKEIVVIAEEPERHGGALPGGAKLLPREAFDAEQRRLRDVTGVSVMIYDQVCAAEKRRRWRSGALAAPDVRVFINEEVCEGCGDCSVQSNCVAIKPVETPLGTKRAIDQSMCNKDLSCLRGFCPSFVVLRGAKPKKTSFASEELAALPEPAISAIGDTFDILVAGVGGTGVATIGALLGYAAYLEGKGSSTLDMVGMAQKGGQVLSHVRIARDQDAVTATRIPRGGADLVLGCDAITAASPDAAALVDPQSGRIAMNSEPTPASEFMTDPDYAYPSAEICAAMERLAPAERMKSLDATKIAARAVGDAIGANLVLLGYAAQSGWLPVAPASIEKAIEANGVAVAANKEAFAWGRRFAHDPDAARRALGMDGAAARPQSLEALIADRMARLTAYQDRAYAERYEAAIRAFHAAETGALGGAALTEQAARSLYKLMAYKDEYEVARLHMDSSFRDRLGEAFEGDIRMEYRLAPPILARKNADGTPRKSAFPAWFIRPVFTVLAKLKGLRGGWADLFGHTAERRMERRLIAEFEALLKEMAGSLSPGNAGAAASLVALPQSIRGFGHIKAAAAAKAEETRERLLAEFRDPPRRRKSA